MFFIFNYYVKLSRRRIFVYNSSSLRTIPYETLQDEADKLTENAVSSQAFILHPSVIKRKNSYRRNPKTHPNARMIILFAMNSWREVPVKGNGREFLLLRLKSIILAIGSMLPTSYEDNEGLLHWPTIGSLIFVWGDFLKALLYVRNVRSFTLSEKIEIQTDFFAIFVTRKLIISDKNKKSNSFVHTIYNVNFAPNWQLKLSVDITPEIKIGKELLSRKILGEITFTGFDPNTQLDFEQVNIFFPTILSQHLWTLGLKKCYVKPIQALFCHLLVNTCDFNRGNFNIQNLHLELSYFCNLIGYAKIFEKRDYPAIHRFLIKLNKAFSSLQYGGRVIFPAVLTRKSIIFIEVFNLENVQTPLEERQIYENYENYLVEFQNYHIKRY